MHALNVGSSLSSSFRFKALVNMKDKEGNTALHLAMEKEMYSRVLILLEFNAGRVLHELYNNC